MKRFRASNLFTGFCFVLFVIPSVVTGQGPDEQWQSFDERLEKRWQEYARQADVQWEQLEREHQEMWLEFKAEVEEKWDRFVDSTKKTWVNYGKNLDARSEVDFETGSIAITAVIPADAPNLKKKGTDKIAEQVKKIFSTDNPANLEALKDQVKNEKGDTVSSKNIEEFTKKEILPTINVEKKPYKAKDGIERTKVEAKISMVPDHISIRAKKYLNTVNEQGQRFDVEPQLILAIIHTESFFNPMARSSRNALGLMQLIPRYGARDAYNFVYKDDKVLPAEYLYDPKNNVELGTAYIHLLTHRHFRKIKDSLKNQYLAICGYNWGPTAVQKKIVKRHNVDSLDSKKLYALLRKNTPQETRDYLKKVIERMRMYESIN